MFRSMTHEVVVQLISVKHTFSASSTSRLTEDVDAAYSNLTVADDHRGKQTGLCT